MDPPVEAYLYDILAARKRAEDGDYLILDLSADGSGIQETAGSVEHVKRSVHAYLQNKEQLVDFKKLCVVGEWVYAADDDDEKRSNNSDQGKTSTMAKKEQEWVEGIETIARLIKAMTPTHLVWITNAPFTQTILDALPSSLEVLVIDVGNPVHLNVNDNEHPIYLSVDEMRSLVQFTQLKELRIFGMRTSYQSVIWETVYKNEGLIDVLELHMEAEPLIRQEGWFKPEHVRGLNVRIDEGKEYKGMDGKGILHYTHGTGEYLDDFCIRKARLASGILSDKAIPLLRLKLNGFVVDQLPFKEELSRVPFLCFGPKCVDAGLRAPKVLVHSRVPNNWDSSHWTRSMIIFPKWFGIFDAEGQLLVEHGHPVTSDDSADTSEEALKAVQDGLLKLDLAVKRFELELQRNLVENRNGFASDIDLDSVSVASTRGSEVPRSPWNEGSDLNESMLSTPTAPDVSSTPVPGGKSDISVADLNKTLQELAIGIHKGSSNGTSDDGSNDLNLDDHPSLAGDLNIDPGEEDDVVTFDKSLRLKDRLYAVKADTLDAVSNASTRGGSEVPAVNTPSSSVVSEPLDSRAEQEGPSDLVSAIKTPLPVSRANTTDGRSAGLDTGLDGTSETVHLEAPESTSDGAFVSSLSSEDSSIVVLGLAEAVADNRGRSETVTSDDAVLVDRPALLMPRRSSSLNGAGY